MKRRKVMHNLTGFPRQSPAEVLGSSKVHPEPLPPPVPRRGAKVLRCFVTGLKVMVLGPHRVWTGFEAGRARRDTQHRRFPAPAGTPVADAQSPGLPKSRMYPGRIRAILGSGYTRVADIPGYAQDPDIPGTRYARAPAQATPGKTRDLAIPGSLCSCAVAEAVGGFCPVGEAGGFSELLPPASEAGACRKPLRTALPVGQRPGPTDGVCTKWSQLGGHLTPSENDSQI